MNTMQQMAKDLNWYAQTNYENIKFATGSHVTAMMKRHGKHVVTNIIEKNTQLILLNLLKH
jgi:hypothetical protein